jgi:hypothetical protein
MKLLKLLAESVTSKDLVNKLKDKGAKVVGSGDYGVVLELGGKAYKVTTDEVELEHAQILKGKKTKFFVHIYDVKVINPKLGVITMQSLIRLSAEDKIGEHFVDKLLDEADSLGIDPDELDIWIQGDRIKRDNFMKDPATGNLKMVDV